MKNEHESLCLLSIKVDSKKMQTYNSQTYHPTEDNLKCELNGDHFSKDGKVLYMKHFHRDLGKVDLNGVHGITKCYRLAYHTVSQENSTKNIKEKEELQTDFVETDAVYSANLTGNEGGCGDNLGGGKELYRKKKAEKKGRNGNNEIESEFVCVSEGNTERDEKKKMLKSKRKPVNDKKENKDTVINNEGLGPITIQPEENVEKEPPQLVNDLDTNRESNDNELLSLPKKPTLKSKKNNFVSNNKKESDEIDSKVKLEKLKAKVKNNPTIDNKDSKEPFFSDNLSNPLFSFINTADTKSYKNLLEKIKTSKANIQSNSPHIDNDDFYNPKSSYQRTSIFDSIKPYSIAINAYQSSKANLFSQNKKTSEDNVEINGVKAPKSIKELKDKFYTLDSNRKTSLRDISGMIKVEESKSIWGEQDLSSRSQLKCYPINYKPFNLYIVDSMIYPPNNMHETALKIDNQKLFK